MTWYDDNNEFAPWEIKEIIDRVNADIKAKKKMKWKSKALWPPNTFNLSDIKIYEKVPFISEDTHDSRKVAVQVCKILERDGFGGEGKIFPIYTWVEPIIE